MTSTGSLSKIRNGGITVSKELVYPLMSEWASGRVGASWSNQVVSWQTARLHLAWCTAVSPESLPIRPNTELQPFTVWSNTSGKPVSEKTSVFRVQSYHWRLITGHDISRGKKLEAGTKPINTGWAVKWPLKQQRWWQAPSSMSKHRET